MKLSTCLLVLYAVLALTSLTEAKKIKTDAARYDDCDSCVAAGFGWSWDEHACGSFVNTDCHDESNDHSNHVNDDEYSVEEDEVFEDESAHQPVEKDFSWGNTEITTIIWQLVNAGDVERFTQLLEHDSDLWRYRSADGRGALWWAYEYGQDEIVELLLAAGADADATDVDGKKPADMALKSDL